ncbi:glycosyltransferase [Bradyrhizobium sp. Ai1a-2]|uniref:glycosyltransferase n=1 Tax=Bradyrhizobium sp. Ai1a-2 TaxID=196490 RepID=UPI0007E8B69B|nr:glycosyltransferase [Bradyrhizobium sp. Ai1a-2]
MWSRYKAVVFSALHREAERRGDRVTVYQIAETELRRESLAPLDTSWHEYPYVLLFKGAYSAIPKLKLFWSLASKVWSDKADLTILTGFERPEVWVQVLALLTRRKRFAFFCDSTIFDKQQSLIKGLAKRILFRSADGIFCYGERASQYLRHYGVPPEKIFVRCQAAALPRNYSEQAALARRMECNAPIDQPRYLYVGRLSEEKSVDKLLHAFAEVVKSLPGARLEVVGKGPQEQQLRSLANKLRLSDTVEFAGAKFDAALFDVYLSATCLVLPSYSEPWGLVVNESLSYGCPVIVSNRCGCVPELVVEGKTGYSFAWDNPFDLTEKLLRAPDTFKDVGATARACIGQISSSTPLTAAHEILDGSARICGRDIHFSHAPETSTG